MREKTPEKNRPCYQHLFSLTPLKHGCHFQKVITVQFCQKLTNKLSQNSSNNILSKKNKRNSRKNKEKIQACLSINLPTFNRDSNYGSPGFTLTSEKMYYTENFLRILYEHQRHVQNIERENPQICIPKPGSKNNFCSVCKQQYDEYISHITSSNHKNKILQSKFNEYIFQLQQKMQRLNPHNCKNSFENLMNSNSQKLNGCFQQTTTPVFQNFNQTPYQHKHQLLERGLNQDMDYLYGSLPRKMLKLDPYFCVLNISKHLTINNINNMSHSNAYGDNLKNIMRINHNNPNLNLNDTPNFQYNQKSPKINFHTNSNQKYIPFLSHPHQNNIPVINNNLNNAQNQKNGYSQLNNSISSPHQFLKNMNHTNNPFNGSLKMPFLNQNLNNNLNSVINNYHNTPISPPPSFYPLFPHQIPQFIPYQNYAQQFNVNLNNYFNFSLDPNLAFLLNPLITTNSQVLMQQIISAYQTVKKFQDLQRVNINNYNMNNENQMYMSNIEENEQVNLFKNYHDNNNRQNFQKQQQKLIQKLRVLNKKNVHCNYKTRNNEKKQELEINLSNLKQKDKIKLIQVGTNIDHRRKAI